MCSNQMAVACFRDGDDVVFVEPWQGEDEAAAIERVWQWIKPKKRILSTYEKQFGRVDSWKCRVCRKCNNRDEMKGGLTQ